MPLTMHPNQRWDTGKNGNIQKKGEL